MENRKLWIVFSLLLLSSFSFSLEMNPYSIKELDATVTQIAFGSISGQISRGDELTIEFITFNDKEMQDIKSQNAEMRIGTDIIEGKLEKQNSNRIAVFEIDDLYEYKDATEFELEIKTRIVRQAEFEVGRDHNLLEEITDFPLFKGPTKNIESKDPDLISKASIEFTKDSGIETIREIAEWVKRNITYDYANYYHGTYSAKHTYEVRAGVCDEFANLTAVFLRIKGIPVKYVSGISFDGKKFGNHGWLKAYLPEKWYSVDSTYGEAFFLDAAHLEMVESNDAEEISDIRIETKSLKGIKTDITIEEPLIEVNSVKQFEGLTEIELKVPERINQNEEFDFNVNIKNVSGKRLMIPVELTLHSDFDYSDNEQILVFEEDEEKELSWRMENRVGMNPGSYLTYSAFFKVPDHEEEFSVKVYYKSTQIIEKAEIEVEEIVPKIDYENNTLQLSILLVNKGNKDGELSGSLYYEEESLGNFEKTIDAGRRLEVKENIENFKSGTYTIELNIGETLVYSVFVPEEPEDEIIVTRKDNPPPIIIPPEDNNKFDIDLLRDPLLLYSLIIGVGAAVFLMLLALTIKAIIARIQ